MPQYIPKATNVDGLDPMVRAYLECAEWCGIDDEQREDFEGCDSPRWSDDSIRQAIEDCADFRRDAGSLLDEWDDEQAGHDFWLTRNGHGTGFWDRGLDAGDALTKLCRPYGEMHVWLDGDTLTLE